MSRNSILEEFNVNRLAVIASHPRGYEVQDVINDSIDRSAGVGSRERRTGSHTV